IGGVGSANQLVSGIRNLTDDRTVSMRIVCKASIDGVPIRLAGLVVADAESLASNEFIHATADGEWTLVEVNKNLGEGAYNVRKEIVMSGGWWPVPTSRRTMK